MSMRGGLMSLGSGLRCSALSLFAASSLSAARTCCRRDVYNAEIAEVGQFTVQQHLNYTMA
jgi:hypothetical protein